MATQLESNPGVNSLAPIREIHEISIVITAKNLNPTMMSLDFLKFSGIIPNDWEVNRQPVLNPNVSQLSFQNGLNIVAQPRTITFMEVVGTQETPQLAGPAVAQQYIDKLPNAEYQAISISPKSVVPFPDSQDSARKYITQILLSPGPWQEVGKAPMQAGLNLLYQLEKCQFALNINEARLQLPDQTALAAILFAGNFNYAVDSENQSLRLQQLKQAISDWESDWKIFQDIVNERFLGKQESLFPSLKA